MNPDKMKRTGGVMARRRQTLLIGLVVAGLFAALDPLGSAALAETIPLPTPAPLRKEGKVSQPAARPAPAQPTNPISSLAAGLKSLFHLDQDQPEQPSAAGVPMAPGGFTAAQRAQVDKVSAYLSSVQQLV